MLISGTGLVVTKHAVERWLERYRNNPYCSVALFDFEREFSKALRLSGLMMWELTGLNKVSYNGTTFVLRGKTVVTCYV